MGGIRSVVVSGKKVGPGNSVFIIAEAGSNHNGDFKIAKSLIEAAAKSGADAVKFQLFRGAHLYARDSSLKSGVDPYAELDSYSLPWTWVEELKSYAEDRGLVFLCSAFDEQAIDRLASVNIGAFKIASPELNHLPLVRRAARWGVPLLLSTGLSTLGEIEETLECIRVEGTIAPVVLLHCVTGYPVPNPQANLGVIRTLSHCFGLPVGYSDHTMDTGRVPRLALALGATVIEKHFTLSRELTGPDHPFALEPFELETMVRGIRSMETIDPEARLHAVLGEDPIEGAKIVGHGRKERMPIEEEFYPHDKRSIHAIRNILKGEALSSDNIRILRSPSRTIPGLHPRYWEAVLGAQVSKDICEGETVRWGQLLVGVG